MKINLDVLSIKEILEILENNNIDLVIFYNSKEGTKLNGEKILKIIYYLNKYNKNLHFYFYNIPFCFFKKFGEIFINKHCIKNRLCNYYDGYITYEKCNICKYGLFCNNFNKNIIENNFLKLEGFYEKDTISKDYLLNIIFKYHKFLKKIGYKENELSFYVTQKYIIEFLLGDINKISKVFLKYLTLYFLVKNNNISKEIFYTLDSFTLVLKDNKLNKGLEKLIKDFGINLNLSNEEYTNDKRKILYKNEGLYLDYYSSRLKYFGENERRVFFDFNEKNLKINNCNIFSGKILNKIDQIVFVRKIYIIKNVNDLTKNNNNYYIGRDILGGVNLNKYKYILLSSDLLGNKGRFIQSLKSIKIPVIYDIYPDLTEFLKNGDNIKINFNKGIIEKIN